jgi:serine/threonine-protein kinase SRPK3
MLVSCVLLKVTFYSRLRSPSNSVSKGDFCAGIPIPEPAPLEHRLTSLEGEDRECFLRFMWKMLQWEPEKRSSASELAEDEWIIKYTT